MITVMLWFVLANGQPTDVMTLQGVSCAEVIEYLRSVEYQPTDGVKLYCAEGFEV